MWDCPMNLSVGFTGLHSSYLNIPEAQSLLFSQLFSMKDLTAKASDKA